MLKLNSHQLGNLLPFFLWRVHPHRQHRKSSERRQKSVILDTSRHLQCCKSHRYMSTEKINSSCYVLANQIQANYIAVYMRTKYIHLKIWVVFLFYCYLSQWLIICVREKIFPQLIKKKKIVCAYLTIYGFWLPP